MKTALVMFLVRSLAGKYIDNVLNELWSKGYIDETIVRELKYRLTVDPDTSTLNGWQ